MIWGTGKLPVFMIARMAIGFDLESQTRHLFCHPAAEVLPFPHTTETV